MTFEEILAQVRELLQSKGRVSYRALKLQFNLDDDYLEGLEDELIKAERLAADEGGKVLVWVGSKTQETENRGDGESETSNTKVANSQPPVASSQPVAPSAQHPSGERRQLTVMFCDLVGSTALSERLDPEELREVVQEYQAVCGEIIHRFGGYIARYVGDALLVYFGYPVAHEDDAQRAVRAGLGIVAALPQLNTRVQHKAEVLQISPLQVRIGIHTGLVVVGEMRGSDYRESMALGETPNIAARLQGLAEPDTVVVSAATYRLVQGLFECQDLGSRMVKGISAPLSMYRVVRESEAQSRFEVAVRTGLIPLIGREHEVGLLQERWQRAKQGAGQVVLLSGEAGIGKSRLVQELREHVIAEGATRIEFRCSPHHQNSAFYPLIEHLQRLLQFEREDTPQTKLIKLQQTLARYRFPQADTLPLLASLLSLQQPEGTPPIALSPQKQKQKTQEALVAWIVEEAEKASVSCTWEDLHWADPSTLEVLTLFLEQIPTARIFTVLTCRLDFTPPWGSRSYLTQLMLSGLGRQQVETMVEKVTGGKILPVEVVQQIVAKTDGVPLFVEELTKSVVESVGAIHELPLQLGIPATLQDALMARLDRLGAAKEVAQLGATLGREFSYELLRAVSPLDGGSLQQGLRQLVDAELLYQRGLLPQATYLFKHALVQDAAYQSLLKSKRQQLHQQITQVLEEKFLETKETQPELLAHHYTEAGLIAQAIPHWQQAGERAVQRSANAEAIAHLTKGIELLKTLPDTPERAQQELILQIALGVPLVATKGQAAPETARVYSRARELSRQVGETPQLFPALWGLWRVHFGRAEYQTARELAEQLLRLAQSVQDPELILEAHRGLGLSLYQLGELGPALEHLERGIALYDPQRHRVHDFLYVWDPGMICLSYAAVTLWNLGYPDQALEKIVAALDLARELSHPHSRAFALCMAAIVHQIRREVQAVQERAEAAVMLCTEQGFPQLLALGTILRGWALAEQGQTEGGIAQMSQGLAAFRDTGAEAGRPYDLALLADTYGKVGQPEEGLNVVTEALAAAHKSQACHYGVELYRLKGELTLQKFQVSGSKFQVDNPQLEAEEYFLKAVEIARRQQAKSWELRAVMSLARLWQQQGKKDEARQLLAEIYGWFTEGFDTKDLQEARVLLEELSH